MNNTTRQGGNGLADTPEEELLVIIIAVVACGALLGSVGVLWLKGVTWLVEHHILIAATSHPAVAIPGAEGAGLDGPRIAIAVALLVATLAGSISAGRRRLARRRQEAG